MENCNETTEALADTIDGLSDLGPFLAKRNNAKNIVYTSNIPQKCKDEPCMLGVDEAGRGPVLGPMVYGIAFCPLSDGEVLKTLGCADSKQLTEETRETIFDDMNRKEYANTTVGWAVEAISPNIISRNMLKRTKYSLNAVSMDSAIGLINAAIDLGVNIAEIYVDTVGPPDKYQAKLSALFPDFQITVAKKADSTYPIVSAASICAKVTRDHALKVWKFPEGLDKTNENFGSGYPNDPKTVSFLQESTEHYFGFPRIVRFSWSTAEKVLTNLTCPVTFEDGDEKPKAGRSIKKFFKGENGDKVERSDFFKERFLESSNFEFM